MSCGDKATQKVVLVGTTTFKELKSMFGEPKRVDTVKIPAVAASQVAVYSESQKYQIENDKVVAEFRAPYENEKSFLYWKHLCRHEKTTWRSLRRKVDNHLKAEEEFSCKQSRITVVYDPNVDKIVRVINYGVKHAP